MALLDEEGQPATLGTSTGRWLEERDFVFCGAGHEGDLAAEVGGHAFPRGWPEVYGDSEALGALLEDGGPCAARRVEAVPSPAREHQGLVHGLPLHRLQSQANAERVGQATGLALVEGWAIYDLLEDVTGAAFVAERYWWNAAPDGTWLDFSPRAENVHQLLLAEASVPLAPKQPTTLTREHRGLAEHLLARRFPKAAQDAKRACVSLAAEPCGGGTPLGPEAAKELTRKLRMGIPEPIYSLLKRAPESAKLCETLVHAGLPGALCGALRSRKHAGPAAQLLAAVTGWAARGGFHEQASGSLLEGGALELLVELVSSGDPDSAASASLALGHASFRCLEVQGRAARAGALRALLRLVRKTPERVADDAAYCLWHLLVGNKANATAALAEGATAALLGLLREGRGDRARQYALGALAALSDAFGSQDELAEAGGVQSLCALISGAHSVQVQTRAAAALAVALRGHRENCRLALQAGGLVPALVDAVRAGPLSRSEHAAGALANLLAACGPAPADLAAAPGAAEGLAALFSAGSRRAGVLAAMANLARWSPEDRRALLPEGAAELVVACLQDRGDPVLTQALAFCTNVSSEVAARSRLLKAGAAKPLVRLVEDADETVREWAAGSLSNLMDGHAESVATVYLQVPDLPRRLVYALETEYSVPIQRVLARAVALLAGRYPEQVRRAGAREPLAEVLEEQSAWEPALGLMNLAPVGKDRHELVKRGAVVQLARLLGSADTGSHSAAFAAGALANLTAGCPEASDQARAAGASGPLLRLLGPAGGACGGPEAARYHLDRLAAEWAAGALGNLVEHGPALFRAEVVAGGALGPLVRLLTDELTSAPELAVFALGALAPGEPPEELRGLLRGSGAEASALAQTAARAPGGPLLERSLSLLRLARD